MAGVGALLGASGDGSVQALTLVGAVLLESILLYVVYGALTRALEPTVRKALGGE